MGSWVQYDKWQEGRLNGNDVIDHDDAGTTIKVAILTASYTPDRASDQYWGDVSTYEVSGTNYTAGGNAIANKTVTTASNVTTFDADDPATWAQSGSGFSDGQIFIVYKDTGTPATSPLIAYCNHGASVGNVVADLQAQLDATGILTLS